MKCPAGQEPDNGTEPISHLTPLPVISISSLTSGTSHHLRFRFSQSVLNPPAARKDHKQADQFCGLLCQPRYRGHPCSGTDKRRCVRHAIGEHPFPHVLCRGRSLLLLQPGPYKNGRIWMSALYLIAYSNRFRFSVSVPFSQPRPGERVRPQVSGQLSLVSVSP